MQLVKALCSVLMGTTVASALALPPQAEVDELAFPLPAADGKNCDNAKKLAAGIDKNIEIQKKEESDLATIEKILNSNSVSKDQFDQAKSALLTTINDGIKIRKDNQLLAKGTEAAPGLDKVENAQGTELTQAQGLKGTKEDLNTVAQLKKEFSGGIDQNQMNKQAALKGC